MSLSLGAVDNPSRVSTVPAGPGVATTEGGEGGGSMAGDVHSGRGGVGSVASVAVVTSVSSVTKTIEGVSIGLSLGDMNHAGRVGNVATSASVQASDGRHSSGGKASDTH